MRFSFRYVLQAYKLYYKFCVLQVKHIKLFPSDCDIPTVIYALQSSVRLYPLHARGNGYSGEVTEVHNVYGAAVDAMDYKIGPSYLGVALGPESWGGNDAGLKV